MKRGDPGHAARFLSALASMDAPFGFGRKGAGKLALIGFKIGINRLRIGLFWLEIGLEIGFQKSHVVDYKGDNWVRLEIWYFSGRMSRLEENF